MTEGSTASCNHPVDKVKFLHCSAADRWPGVWSCECGATFNHDPTGQTSVRYLKEPNVKATKEVKFPTKTGKW